jgi:hypothetical protein
MIGKAEPNVSERSEMTLSITFQGPFLFDFKDSPEDDLTVDIYAPYCAYHEAGIFFGDSAYSETDLANAPPVVVVPTGEKVPRKYFIAGPGIKACSTVPNQIYPHHPPRDPSIEPYNDPLLKPLETETLTLNPGKVLFQFTVPRPSHIYPLYCDVVQIRKSFDEGPGQSALMPIHATGLRFSYAWDSTTSIYLYARGTDPSKNAPPTTGVYEITPAAAGNCPGLANHGSIDIRYQGLEQLDRNDPHSDARSCFASLATMAGATQWWLDYGDGLAEPADPIPPDLIRETFTSYTGGDCGAPVIGRGLPPGNKP